MKNFHKKTIQVLLDNNIKFLIGSDSLVGLSDGDIYKYSHNLQLYLFPLSFIKILIIAIKLLNHKIIMKPKNLGNNYFYRLRSKLTVFSKEKSWIKITFFKNYGTNQSTIYIGNKVSIYNNSDLEIDYINYKNTILPVPKDYKNFSNLYKDELLSNFYKKYYIKFDQNSEKNAVDFLYRINQILKRSRLSFWIEGGTLLGAIRDGKLIPWDHDLDMGIINNNDNEINKLIILLKKEFYVSIKNFEKIDGVWNLGKYRVIKVYPKKYLFFKKKICCDLFIYYKGSIPNNKEEVYKYVVWGKNGFHKKEFFDQLDTMSFYGFNINIPSNSNKFLEAKYGKDWKIPKKRWNVAIDDGSILRD